MLDGVFFCLGWLLLSLLSLFVLDDVADGFGSVVVEVVDVDLFAFNAFLLRLLTMNNADDDDDVEQCENVRINDDGRL